MHIGVRIGRVRLSGGLGYWLTLGPVWLACYLMFGTIWCMARATTCAVRWLLLRRSAGCLTPGQRA